jgi:Zn-dependent M28 family amino/carboxypeptidase
MNVKHLAAAFVATFPLVAQAQIGASDAFAAREPSRSDLDFVRTHVRFLADDLLGGRAPGTHGGDVSARYLASQLELLGVEPGGENGTYFQRVPLLGIKTDYEKSRATIVKDDPAAPVSEPLAFLDEVVLGNESQVESVEVDAEIVFVGYGIRATEQNWNDYKDVDVKGKVLLMLANDPPSEDPKVFGGKGLTYYGRWTYKYEEAARRGAAGAIVMHRDDLAGYGWNVVRTSFSRERPYVDARTGATKDVRNLPLVGWASEPKTRRIVELAGKNLDTLVADAAKPEFQPVPLGLRLTATVVSSLRTLETANVLGVIPGAKRRNEAVVFTAHYDHLGIDDALIKEGKDGIYNGAVDNATGCAALLWIARETMHLDTRPDRSFVFLFTTAEEGGLRGSQYYVANPTFPHDKIAVDLNLDALVVSGEPTEFEPLGYDRITAQKSVELAAREFDVALLPDSSPELGIFYRSDHFPFAKAGIPAINFKAGKKRKGVADDVAAAAAAIYPKQHYHQPSDEFDPTWDFVGLVKTARFTGRIAWRVSQEAALPKFVAGDEFAR